jgi:hypothetical protein
MCAAHKRSGAARRRPLKKEKVAMKAVRMALTAALIGALSLQVAASPYHRDRLPNGQITGPIAPDANGG